jgi:EAL domain-containing protein (putative c-di-GMP-specific phosphodiesterase class I)
MILLRETDEQGAKSFVTELLARFSNPWLHENGEHYLDAGVGVALYPGNLTTPDEIYRAADLALYKATEYGANSFAFYTDEFKKAADINYHHAEQLRDAITDGMKGFKLRYQPMAIVSYLEGEKSVIVPRYEAYISWDFLPTTKLMQLAENMGLDTIIDSWVIKNACLFCKKMQQHEPDFSISINISARGLRSGSIITMISEALSKSGLDGSSLSVEIPERIFSDRQDGVLPVLKKLRLLGVKLVIDSFGADYGGLRFLKHSLMDMVKMDFSLFTNIFGKFDEIWVGAAAKLASSLRNGICVKRVEDEAQLEEAKKFGVKYAQGFLFAKPMTGEEVAKRLQKGAKVK